MAFSNSGNRSPLVEAGENQLIILPGSTSLNGTVLDDGLPDPPGAVTTLWSQVSGTGTVTFGDASVADTTASFSEAGSYVLRLTAGDGELAASDEVTILVFEEGGQVISLEVRVAASLDDAEEKANGSMSIDSAVLELVRDGHDQTVGIRFNGVYIPQGTTVVNAYIQFQTDEPNLEETLLMIEGEDAASTSTFTSTKHDISSRPRTVAAVSWSPVPWTTVGQAGVDQRTPNIAAIIQEIVEKPG
jgi:hypothetical protein